MLTQHFGVTNKEHYGMRCDHLATRETAHVFYLALENRIFTTTKKHTHAHTQSRTENSLFHFCLTITKPFPPIYLEEMKNF